MITGCNSGDSCGCDRADMNTGCNSGDSGGCDRASFECDHVAVVRAVFCLTCCVCLFACCATACRCDPS